MLDSSPETHDPQLAARANGVDRIVQELRDARDGFVASDPGWARLRQGVRAVVAVGSTLLVESALAQAIGEPALLGMRPGAVVAMLMSTGIRGLGILDRTGQRLPVPPGRSRSPA